MTAFSAKTLWEVYIYFFFNNYTLLVPELICFLKYIIISILNLVFTIYDYSEDRIQNGFGGQKIHFHCWQTESESHSPLDNLPLFHVPDR